MLLDTGCRIDEVLKLKKADVNLDNLLITVDGKGGKQRRVPFSFEFRKHLYRYLLKAPSDYVFGTRNNTHVSYRNAYRNLKLCLASMGIEGEHIHPHTTRHTFPCNYIRSGGNLYSLSRILGHSSVAVTQTYLRGLQIEETKHHSPLS